MGLGFHPFIHIAGVFVMSRNVAKGLARLSSDTAGVCVISRSVAKVSSDFRPPGPMILGAQAPGKVGHRQVTSERTISYEVVLFVFD